MKIEIEGIGIFSIPAEAATYFQEIAEERIAAIARAEAAERELGLMTAAYESQTLNLENGRQVLNEAEAEAARLSEQVAEMQRQGKGTECAVCGRKNTLEVITLCSYCYEEKIA